MLQFNFGSALLVKISEQMLPVLDSHRYYITPVSFPATAAPAIYTLLMDY